MLAAARRLSWNRAAPVKCLCSVARRELRLLSGAPVRASVVMLRLQRNRLDARGSGQPAARGRRRARGQICIVQSATPEDVLGRR